MKDKHYSSSSSLALKTLYECVRTLNILVSKTGKKSYCITEDRKQSCVSKLAYFQLNITTLSRSQER